MRLGVFLLAAFAMAGCGDDASSADGGTDATNGMCTGDMACDDAMFCNGRERCSPGSTTADARGCVASDMLPCADGVACDEATGACVGDCESMPDADGDGVDGMACGGSDCDDSDRGRFPGNTEICDLANVDEDCDPRTFGFRDADMDLSPDNRCCNTEAGVSMCGNDCDDANPGAHARATESCDLVDNDCDMNTDEGVTTTFFADMDGDGRGVMDMTTEACEPPADYAVLAGDCDDTDPRRHPGNAEVCDAEMIDEDCDELMNEDCMCSGAASRSCTEAGFMGPCALGTQDCLAGRWGACSIAPSTEICNATDDDCDGTTDETFTCIRSIARACTTGCATAGEELCNATCNYDACRAAFETCNYCDDNGSGDFADDRGVATFTQTFTLSGSSRVRYGAADSLSLYSGTTLGSVGAAYFAGPIRLGFGELVFEARVSVIGVGGDSEPDRGWAAVLFADGAGTGFLGVATDLGVPRNRNGYSVEWYFNGSASDRMIFRQLSATGADAEIRNTTSIGPDMPDGGFLGADQQVMVRLTPDVPGTAANEMILRVEQPAGTLIRECTGAGCPQVFSVGQLVWIGLSGANGSSADHRSLTTAAAMTTLRQPESCAP